ncbi:hypothetical protein HK100_000320, partial [Physocladia obscura]
GNAPNNRPEILSAFADACARGVVIVNCSQCLRGLVTDAYATGKQLARLGIVPGKNLPVEECRSRMKSNLRGELTVRNKQMQFAYSNKTQSLVDSVLPLLNAAAATSSNCGLGGPLSPTSPISVSQIQLRETDIGGAADGSGGGIEKVLIPTVLCHAVRNGDLEALTEVCKQYGSLISVGDYDGRTPLHIAASENHYNAVELLLLHGASVHERDRYGHSPLFDAVRGNNTNVARLLMDAGGHFSEEELSGVVLLGTKACFDGNLAMVKLLCECGADLNGVGMDGRTVVHMNDTEPTTSNGTPTATSGIEIKLDIKDRYGRTPLDDAKSLEWTEGIECLEYGLQILGNRK